MYGGKEIQLASFPGRRSPACKELDALFIKSLVEFRRHVHLGDTQPHRFPNLVVRYAGTPVENQRDG